MATIHRRVDDRMSTCPQCSQENPAGVTTCSKCGRSLGPAQTGGTRLGVGAPGSPPTAASAKSQAVPEAVPEYLDTAALDDIMIEPPKPL
ncbi:MAG: hypothetical protein HY906_22185, partial [Deltaproteobacteria bacterium]|nr:hypothetical protein [Deltaproteobacteria bacterium]